MAGISRSTTIVAAYIMAVTELNWKDSIKAIKCSRSIANPNYGFQRQLQDFWNLQASKVQYLHVLYSDCFISVTTGFQWFASETFRLEDENDYQDLIIFAYSKKNSSLYLFQQRRTARLFQLKKVKPSPGRKMIKRVTFGNLWVRPDYDIIILDQAQFQQLPYILSYVVSFRLLRQNFIKKTERKQSLISG